MDISRARERLKNSRWSTPLKLLWAVIKSDETRASAYRTEIGLLAAQSELPDRLSPITEELQTLKALLEKVDSDLTTVKEAVGLTERQVPFSLQINSGGVLGRAAEQLQSSAAEDNLELPLDTIPYLSLYSEQGGAPQRALVRQQFDTYLPLLKETPNGRVLDIGCGAGEFLAYLKDEGFETQGIDLDEFELTRAKAKDLLVEQADAFDFLSRHENHSSYRAILMVEVIEHIEPNRWKELLTLCHQALVPGGLILLETINPMHTLAFFGFYQDLTHLTPASEEFLSFLLELEGYENIHTTYSNPVIIDPIPRTDFKRIYFNFAVTGTTASR